MEKGTKQLWVRRDARHIGTIHARSITCFRHPPERYVPPVGATCAPGFRPRKCLITNECQPIPPYSGRGCPAPNSAFRLPALRRSAAACPAEGGSQRLRRFFILHSSFFIGFQ